MNRCLKCGGHLQKVHRNLFEKMLCSDAYQCMKCDRKSRRFYDWWFSPYRFIFSRYTVCIRCGTHRVHRMSKRDPLDSVSKNPLSLVQQIVRAPRNKCPFCRVQYHDLRPVAPTLQTPARDRPLSRFAAY